MGGTTPEASAVTLVFGPPEWRQHGAKTPGLDPALLVPTTLDHQHLGTNTAWTPAQLPQPLTGPIRAVHPDWSLGTTIGHATIRHITPGQLVIDQPSPVELARHAPLFLVNHTTGGTYTATVETNTEVVYLNTGTHPALANASIGELGDLAPVVDAHWVHLDTLNNHNNSYPHLHKWAAGEEIEHKFDLPDDSDIWAITQALLTATRAHQLGGFAPHLRIPFTRWETDNHLHEMLHGNVFAGYVSFIPEAGGHIVKEKVFPVDQLRRRERVLTGIHIDGPYTDYLRDHYPDRRFVAYPPFRRIRYDIDLESLDTGNHLVISLDQCTTTNGETLRQCEVEYVDSRTIHEPHDVLNELADLADVLEQHLHEIGIRAKRTFRSKLTFLRDHHHNPM